ncbi:MAG: AI-2E family transporter [Hyphomicrobiales bacterium]|nr:AI-2E family transporter [Hyphomicrobiales bacterium]MBV8827134.1 AI-2E family transporter [Hyphomicrobiales bacterium]MBV9426735.1 AI-2E family transporter [Bradyrhizobiaceae bacterium]
MKKPAAPANRPTGADHEHVERMSTWMAILLVILVALLINQLQWILLPFVISGLLAYICTPAIEWLQARTRWPRGLFAVATFLVLLLFACLLGLLGLPSMITGIKGIVTDFQGIVTSAARGAIGNSKVTLLGEPMNAEQLAGAIVTGVRDWLGSAGRLATLATASFATMFGMILTLVLLFYFLFSGPVVARGLLALMPPGQRPLIQHVATQVNPVLRRYFIGVIVVVAYASTAAYVGLGFFLGIPHAVFLALLTGLLEMIPVIGPIAAAVIAGLVAVRYATGIGPIIAYAVYATALRLSIDQLFGPIVLGSAARVHPVVIIFCFLAGGVLFGIVGIILAVPAALVVRTTLAILYDEPQAAPGRK